MLINRVFVIGDAEPGEFEVIFFVRGEGRTFEECVDNRDVLAVILIAADRPWRKTLSSERYSGEPPSDLIFVPTLMGSLLPIMRAVRLLSIVWLIRTPTRPEEGPVDRGGELLPPDGGVMSSHARVERERDRACLHCVGQF